MDFENRTITINRILRLLVRRRFRNTYPEPVGPGLFVEASSRSRDNQDLTRIPPSGNESLIGSGMNETVRQAHRWSLFSEWDACSLGGLSREVENQVFGRS
jgi:hypothetical protein